MRKFQSCLHSIILYYEVLEYIRAYVITNYSEFTKLVLSIWNMTRTIGTGGREMLQAFQKVDIM